MFLSWLRLNVSLLGGLRRVPLEDLQAEQVRRARKRARAPLERELELWGGCWFNKKEQRCSPYYTASGQGSSLISVA